jgi:hypothetical protein
LSVSSIVPGLEVEWHDSLSPHAPLVSSHLVSF